MRITKPWHRDRKRAKAVGKIALIDLLDAGLPQIFILLKKKKKQYLQSTIEQGLHIVHTVRPTQPDGSHKTCSLVLLNPSTQPWFDKWSCTPISSFPICDQINNFSLSYEIHLLIIPHSMCDLSSSTRDQTHTHLLGRWSLYQWTAGEVPIHTFLIGVTSWLNQIIVLKC